MPIIIASYTEEHIPAVKEFNQRLRLGGAPSDYVFSESPTSRWLPPGRDSPVFEEFFIALDNGEVRGTFALKHQEFSFSGEIRDLAYYHHPLSEGIVDKRYAQVGLHMLMHAIRAHPWMYALGMAAYDRPLPRMLISLKWNHCLVPFYFRVSHPVRFLQNIQALRQSPYTRIAADVAAFTGTGWLGLKTVHAIAGLRIQRSRTEVEIVPEFGDWADEIWKRCAAAFSLIAVRDARALGTLFPSKNENFVRLRITRGAQTVGWAVVAVVQKRSHPQYGDLRVGTILDALASAEDAGFVIACATEVLTNRDVDIITSNQTNQAWTRALQRCGYLRGPSNFIFAASRKLSKILQPFDLSVRASHLTRADGDNLLQYL